MENNSRLAEIIHKMRKNGSRLTPQRMAILKMLVADDSHPTVDEVYSAVRQDFPMTSLATVYKTVTLLKEMDEVRELRGDNRASRFDGSAKPSHPHLICRKCRQIIDFELPVLDDLSKTIEDNLGFQVENLHLDIFGLCPDCQKLSSSY